MKIAVRYFSRSGNIKKLAQAVADAVQAEALEVSADLSEKADVLFLGSAVYAGKYDPAVGAFIERNAANIGALAVFSSSASGKSTYAKIKELAQSKGIRVCEEQFVCPGYFLFLHKDRPNARDLADAADFARKVGGKS